MGWSLKKGLTTNGHESTRIGKNETMAVRQVSEQAWTPLNPFA
jgi:hypothetical protein